MGLHVRVYRDARGEDCTIGGVSSQADDLCVVNIPGQFEPSDKAPAVLLVEGNAPGTLRIFPAVTNGAGEWVRDSRWLMMGGNYAATSDSRFSEACEKMLGDPFYGAVPIHDRCEG
jgi:hypothetical protein